ncbi:MAG: hypothetical protein AAF871_12975 [Pseudomonadota bacterium]
MSDMAKAQKDGFSDRIGRIQRGDSPNMAGRIEVGPRDEVRAREADKRARREARRNRARAMRRPRESFGSLLFTLPTALAVGALSFAAGRLAAFHLFTGEGLYLYEFPGWRIELWADFAIAGLVAFFLAWSLHLGHGLRRWGLLFGFAAMTGGESMVMERFPDLFEKVYPASYVTATAAKPVVLF